MTTFMRQYCPRCGYDQVFRRGRCLSCNTRPVDVGPEIHARRQIKKKAKTELSGAGNEGEAKGCLSLPLSARIKAISKAQKGQLKLF